ncbi:hypothetical protein LEP1GSC137_0544 [Leptospira borgpetersenii str. Noumea 25]|uniref:Uncharacterized protein n=4 Tax=Leptospira borgpetersenii TaxID=174 RepID=M3GWK6_LEPBO|nr:hypothetical protein LBBP_00305 [Leptospira borgpetersenii serovar Ballum]EKP13216.1 hypothetical protein LEP1GSC128_3306 [Leptospira borgpetersenii str. 200801926]EKQ91985.1 hypothetical protein LEP1GSC101_3128 [Leptospira borgpetersenii str. UI 09149]EKQ98784.1 hypothetical protein LEP1GSC121_0569 [Leptospira borgpetersenii serovar Castellonis str. 200801910]EMF99218.1 hypothetical protein LEP1GSC123_4654 [Leptospira borgpetersenii str. 200701203]EMK13338.1 hypothetical protein LEP1GSC066
MLRRDGGSRLTNITILRNRKKFGTGFEDAFFITRFTTSKTK